MRIDVGKAEAWMRRVQRETQKYVAQRREEGVPDAAVMELRDYADGKLDRGSAMDGLMLLSSYEGAVGCVRVLDGEEDGWGHLDRSFIYGAWELRLWVAARRATESPSSVGAPLEDAARAWVRAEAMGAKDQGDWILEQFRAVDAGDTAMTGRRANPLPWRSPAGRSSVRTRG
jgi:hypothetical protein